MPGGLNISPAELVLGPNGTRVAGRELFDHLVADVVVILNRRRLHEVGAWAEERSADASILGESHAANSIDNDTRRVW